MSAESELLGIALIVVLAIGAQLVASALRIPAILILLGAGFLAGGLDLIDPDELFGSLYQPLISIAVGVILFQGGLNLHLRDLGGGVRSVVMRLLTVGVLITWATATVAAHLLFDVKFSSALLIGAVLVVTGPTVVIPLLDFIRPTPRVRSVLRWEGITIDPLGAILTVVTFHALTTGVDQPTLDRIRELVLSLGCGLLIGAIGALIMMWLLRSRFTSGRQDATATLMVVVAALAAGDLLRDDTGLIATTFMGIVLANQKKVGTLRIVEFKETLGLLLLGVLFITLAAQVKLDDIIGLGWALAAFVAVLILISRPLAVFFSTVRSDLPVNERTFMAWMAPRGIVAASTASVFASSYAGVDPDAAGKLVPITFGVIIATVAVYGLTGLPVARALKLTKGSSSSVLLVGAHPWALQIGQLLKDQGLEVTFWTTRADYADAVRQAGLTLRNDQLLRDSATDEYEVEATHALVITGIDPFNSIAAAELAEEIGKPYVFQLAEDESAMGSQVTSKLRRGWTLWDENATFAEMEKHFTSGAKLKVEELSSSREVGKPTSGKLELFVIRRNGHLVPLSPELKSEGRAGDRLVSLA